MAANSKDKIALGAALLALLSVGGWMFSQQSKIDALRQTSGAQGGATAYAPAGIDAPKVATKTWPVAPSQARGAEWIYDVFTPPEIYYDVKTKAFSVTPPVTVAPVDSEIPFGVELVAVRQDPFRLQLVGYVGNSPTEYRGTFQNAISGETFLARGGKELPKLGLTIKSFDVTRNRIVSKESMPVYDTVATAVVVDTKTGEETVLTNKERKIKGSPIAVFKATDTGSSFEQKVNTTFTVGDVRYTVRAVTAEPASVDVAKESPEVPEPVLKTLVPPAPPAASEEAPADAKPEPAKPAATLFP